MNEICWKFLCIFWGWECGVKLSGGSGYSHFVLMGAWETQTDSSILPWALPKIAPTHYIQSCLFTLKNSFKIRPTTRIPQTNALYTQFPLISTQFWFVFAKRWARKENEHSCVLKHIKEWFKWWRKKISFL